MGDEERGSAAQGEAREQGECGCSDDGAARAYAEGKAAGAAAGLDPLDFSGFLFGLGQMALVHLGDLVEPGSGATGRDLEQARHTIDILDLLELKTRGNLNEEEEGLLRYLLCDLKLRYVRLAR